MLHAKSVTIALLVVGCLPLGARADVLLPKHTVLAFNLKACPSGWVPYAPAAGAVAMGVGDKITLGAQGAASMDKWVLGTNQIPTFSMQSSGLGHWPVSTGAENALSPVIVLVQSVPPNTQVTPYTLTVSGGSGSVQPIPLPKVSGLLYCENQ